MSDELKRINDRALTIAWETFKLVDPKVNEAEMRSALSGSIAAYLAAIATPEQVALAVFKCAFHAADVATDQLIAQRKRDFQPTWEHAEECADAILAILHPQGRETVHG